jgi:hypothetical protein
LHIKHLVARWREGVTQHAKHCGHMVAKRMVSLDSEQASFSESKPDINLVTLKTSVINLSEMMKSYTNDEAMCTCNHWTGRGD